MGSSVSQPSRSSSSISPPTHTDRSPPNDSSAPVPRPSGTLARLNSLRRLSTLGRSSDNVTKRVRQGSGSTFSETPVLSRAERKKAKKQKRAESSRSPTPTPTSTVSSALTPATGASGRGGGSSVQASTRAPSPVVEDVSMETSEHGESLSTTSFLPIPHIALPTDPLPPQISSELPSPSEDPLIEDRLRSLSTIRDALGPEWPMSNASTAPAVERLMHRFRRSSSFPTVSEQDQGATPTRTMSDRLTALLGFSSPVNYSSPSEPNQPLVSTIPDDADVVAPPTLEELTQRLEEAREELAMTEQQLNQARERQEQARRVPSGAVLVIQGLAQTHTQPNDGESSSSSSGSARSPRSRRLSEGSASGSSPQRQSDDQSATSLDTQARMIGGLLTVAAAATASTLLAPNRPSPTPSPRSPAASTLETIVNRLRPNRPNREPQSVEAALGNYLRNVLRDNRPPEVNTGLTAQTAADASDSHISNDFERFLAGLQGDLVGAVRAFAGPPTQERVEEEAGAPTATEAAGTSQSASPQESTAHTAQPDAGPSTSTSRDNSESTIPSFHYQPGQNTHATGQAAEVTGGIDGMPRRLNFFRAHVFPAVSSTGTSSASADDASAMVPCIFIGVRSIRHDPSMTTEDLVQHPSFPFIDGQVPPNTGAEPSPSTAESEQVSSELVTPPVAAPASTLLPFPSSVPTTTPTPTSERRSLRDRFFDRLNPRREHFEPRQGPLNTYLVYVIGGNYPRSHPILSIPNLVTGGPLTDEEMAMVSELMGPAKPPTVERAEIEKSGLRIVKGSEMMRLREKDEVLESCVERCLICLSEYEAEDECRILKCRHGYHKECVDQWLSTGRNSCPACRSEAVDTNQTSTSAGSTTAGVSSATATQSQGISTSAGPPVQAE
ncbi:hypothetical protein IAR55_003264 [Kwoniella newhampshirensis]|uniref:RING-type domain-containing protein n=1 Tax=Kwoniella newhampshirensis TaxID=1651941 RepID=A0AAW0YZ47_9TREE